MVASHPQRSHHMPVLGGTAACGHIAGLVAISKTSSMGSTTVNRHVERQTWP